MIFAKILKIFQSLNQIVAAGCGLEWFIPLDMVVWFTKALPSWPTAHHTKLFMELSPEKCSFAIIAIIHPA